MKLISVIIATYNWSEALKLCLESLYRQDDPDYEIIIADDGSKADHYQRNLAYCANAPIPIQYAYHEDDGFRASTIRNKAVALSKGEYLLFIDGDCVASRNFICSHRHLARPGYFVPANRVLLNQAFTEQVISRQIALSTLPFIYFIKKRLEKNINRIMPLIKLPLGPLRRLQETKWQKAMTCNLGVWRQDFIQVNGFDEDFAGWGFEDSDLVIRLIHAGIKRQEGRFAAPVFHLWHPSNDKSKQESNYQRLMSRLNQKDLIYAKRGVSQYL